ncbi:MAG: 3-phosphoshikimate 1-carboxyvinyltransferase [Acidobacteria bacterium]|nr:3-phosphoshikimate 1-carboxyvinyltransferase [Acidobacteriota bacterium]
MTGSVTVQPVASPLDATVSVPGSKSIANRAIVCAILAGGSSTIENVPDGDDTRLLIDGCRALGAGIRLVGTTIVVDSGIDRTSAAEVAIDAGLGGTTSRFLTAVAAVRAGRTTLTGGAGLRRRPMDGLHDALLDIGARVEWSGERGRLPVTVSGGPVAGGRVAVSAETSSQFASALVLAGPAMRDGLRLVVPGPRVSNGYLEMSVQVARSFGARIAVAGDTIEIGRGAYGARHYVVEPDASSASFVFAAAALVGGRVVVRGAAATVLQPERDFPAILERMGCAVEARGSDLMVSRRSGSPLVGVDADLSEMSDAVPILAAIATRASSPTTIRGVGFIRGKESNRIDDLAAELRRAGAGVDVRDDGMRIVPGAPIAVEVDPRDDHRLAMAFAVLGLAGGPVTVSDPGVVAKSWPAFWGVLADLVRRP